MPETWLEKNWRWLIPVSWTILIVFAGILAMWGLGLQTQLNAYVKEDLFLCQDISMKLQCLENCEEGYVCSCTSGGVMYDVQPACKQEEYIKISDLNLGEPACVERNCLQWDLNYPYDNVDEALANCKVFDNQCTEFLMCSYENEPLLGQCTCWSDENCADGYAEGEIGVNMVQSEAA